MLVVWFANPFISFDIFEKKSFVAPLPIDVTEDFLISETKPVEIGLIDGLLSFISSSKLCCCELEDVDSPNNPTYKNKKFSNLYK